mmetsp:Transcript_3209/g.7430  ORF Transcript_3209/g.7430 Transcript_3209/m.7430 type:complete len:276 (-) Transcript_3209:7-834(-)
MRDHQARICSRQRPRSHLRRSWLPPVRGRDGRQRRQHLVWQVLLAAPDHGLHVRGAVVAAKLVDGVPMWVAVLRDAVPALLQDSLRAWSHEAGEVLPAVLVIDVVAGGCCHVVARVPGVLQLPPHGVRRIRAEGRGRDVGLGPKPVPGVLHAPVVGQEVGGPHRLPRAHPGRRVRLHLARPVEVVPQLRGQDPVVDGEVEVVPGVPSVLQGALLLRREPLLVPPEPVLGKDPISVQGARRQAPLGGHGLPPCHGCSRPCPREFELCPRTRAAAAS